MKNKLKNHLKILKITFKKIDSHLFIYCPNVPIEKNNLYLLFI